MLPKSPSESLSYGRRLTKMVYLTVAVMVLVSLLVGFFGAYAKLGGFKKDPRVSVNRKARMKLLKLKEREKQEVETALGMNDKDDAKVKISHGVGEDEEIPLTVLMARSEKPDLFEVLRQAQSHVPVPPSAQSAAAAAGEEVKEAPLQFQDLNFALVVEGAMDETRMAYLRGFVGGLHRLRGETHQVPRIHLFTAAKVDTVSQLEEISTWNKVELHNLQTWLSLPLLESFALSTDAMSAVKDVVMDRLAKEYGHAIWVRQGYVFDPAHKTLSEAEKTEDPVKIKEAVLLGQKYLIGMVRSMETRGYVRITATGGASEDLLVEGYLAKKPEGFKILQDRLDCFFGKSTCDKAIKDTEKGLKTFASSSVGLFAFNPKSDLMCNLDIRPDPILNVLLAQEVAATKPGTADFLQRWQDPKLKRLAVAMPTTSKGLKGDLQAEPILFRNTISSMLNTLQPGELDHFAITVYIGYDHDDKAFDDPTLRDGYIKKLEGMFAGKPIQAKFVRFPKTNRVGMLWSMLFVKAMKEGADYFYQVNDDLTMVTAGWLTKFTAALDGNSGFGVVGPADNHNGFNCSLLTQAMVSRTHYDIFTLFYPNELKDWKTDRWLSNVYGPEHTFCWHDYIANNGGAPTRYQHCPFLSWKIYLEAGKERIQSYLAEHPLPRKSPPSLSNA